MIKKLFTASLLLTTLSISTLSAQNSTPVNNESFLKNQIQVKQQENTDGAKNVGLYKTRAKTTPPVGMPKH